MLVGVAAMTLWLMMLSPFQRRLCVDLVRRAEAVGVVPTGGAEQIVVEGER